MMAMKHFALRDDAVNVTILVAVELKNEDRVQANRVLERSGFKVLPEYERSNPHQKVILKYVGNSLERHPRELACGARNLFVKDAESKVGRLSAVNQEVNEPFFEPQVVPVRSELAKAFTTSVLRYLCLPPMDLDRLAHQAPTMVIDQRPVAHTGDTGSAVITEQWLRSRSRDLAFVAWVGRKWPQGGALREVLDKIPYADWLISLLGYTRYLPTSLEGKKMLVRLACVCAARAQVWVPKSPSRKALAAAERWVLEPTDERRKEAMAAMEEVSKLQPDPELINSGGSMLYIAEAAKDAAMRAAIAAGDNDPSRIISSAARAAAAAVATASFASNAPESSIHDTWLDLISAKMSPSEAAEHKALCNAVRRVVSEKERGN